MSLKAYEVLKLHKSVYGKLKQIDYETTIHQRGMGSCD